MAEGVVLGDDAREVMKRTDPDTLTVSLTASGRVRVRVVRRSYNDGEKPVVDIAPDRLVVLKRARTGFRGAVLPSSPRPTQDEVARAGLERRIEVYTDSLRRTEAPDQWERPEPAGPTAEAVALADYHAWCARQLTDLRKKLRDLDEAE